MKVKHPVFKDVEKDVSKDELADYLAAGWLEKNQRRAATVNTSAETDETSPATAEED